jgi:hypothetical protein
LDINAKYFVNAVVSRTSGAMRSQVEQRKRRRHDIGGRNQRKQSTGGWGEIWNKANRRINERKQKVEKQEPSRKYERLAVGWEQDGPPVL